MIPACYNQPATVNDPTYRKCLRRFITNGTLIGHGVCGIRWYVVDGQVWCDKSTTQIHYAGRYEDFMDRVRKGHIILTPRGNA